jgi:ParB/RepB/Spo0J family partition protein
MPTTLIALAALVDSPYQPPGRSERGIDELVASMDAPEGASTRGQTTPLLVRLLDDGTYRIVGGHRRRRALERRGATHALCIARQMTDSEERELALVDNVQRADLSALEEADELGRMRDELGYSPERIAGRIGKSSAHVYSRLALLRLAPACREALAAGRIPLGAATGRLSLSTVGEAEQLTALEDILAPWRRDEISISEVRRIVGKYHLRLATSGIPLDDATLVPAAGACAKCPKRSGAQLQLLGEAEPDERCTDAACFKTKQEAVWARTKKTAKADGVRLVEGAEAKKLYPYNGESLDWGQRTKLVDLDAEYPHDPQPDIEDEEDGEDEDATPEPRDETPRRTWAEALGAAAKPEALVKTEYGTVRRLMTVEAAGKAMKAAGLTIPVQGVEPSTGAGAQLTEATPEAPRDKTWEVERLARERMIDLALAAIVEHAEGCTTVRVNHMRHLVALLVRAAPEDRIEDILRRRAVFTEEEIAKDWPVEKGWKAMLDIAAKASLGELLGLAIEIVVTGDEYFPPTASQNDTAFHIAARFAELDIEKLTKAAEKKVKAELEAERKGKTEKVKKSSKKGAAKPEAPPPPVAKAEPKPPSIDLSVVCPRCHASKGIACKKEGGGTHVQRTKLAADERADEERVDAAKVYATAAREKVWNACDGGATRAKIEELTGLSKAVVEKETQALFMAGRLSLGLGDVYTRVGHSLSVGPLDVACGKCGANRADPCRAENGRATKPHQPRIDASLRAAAKLDEPAPDAAGDELPPCRTCGCTAAKPCEGPDGDCDRTITGGDLCTECAAVMQEIEKRLHQGRIEETALVTEIEELFDELDEGHVDDVRIRACLDDLVNKQRSVWRMPHGFVALQPELPGIKGAPKSADLETEIQVELSAGASNAAMLCAALKRPRAEVDAALVALLKAGKVESRDGGLWALPTVREQPAEPPQKRKRGRPKGAKNKARK